MSTTQKKAMKSSYTEIKHVKGMWGMQKWVSLYTTKGMPEHRTVWRVVHFERGYYGRPKRTQYGTRQSALYWARASRR